MRARLLSKKGQSKGILFEVGDEAVLGRDTDNQVVISRWTVSRKHARIFYDEVERAYFVEDLRSSNGTEVGGVAVEGRTRLSNDEVITLGGTVDLIFQVVDRD